MTIYADLDANNIVINVIVADQDFISQLPNANEYLILTRGGIGWSYDSAANVFIAPQPFASWTLDSNHDWQPPTPKPDGMYSWDEAQLKWIELV
jgi:hypothetical protein